MPAKIRSAADAGNLRWSLMGGGHQKQPMSLGNIREPPSRWNWAVVEVGPFGGTGG
jgi:hypothetical protein